MTSTIRHLTIDCRDPYALAQFWAGALAFVDDPDNPNRPGDPEALLVDPRGLHPGLLFLPVPEPKTAKNRMHLDWDVEDMAAEADRLVALGATRGEAHHRGRVAWICMQDPEGNEFCLEQVMD